MTSHNQSIIAFYYYWEEHLTKWKGKPLADWLTTVIYRWSAGH
jgi:hypothetical protein